MSSNGEWKSTACVLCSVNCGLQVQVEHNQITKVRGDKTNPFSRGYTCSKGLTIAKYATHAQRVTTPLKRRPDGTHAPISWDQAIGEIAGKLSAIIARHSSRAVGLVGGGGQGNHLDFVYAAGFLKLLDSPWHFNALAQEYTQKYWVNRHVFGSDGVDFEGNAHRSGVFMVIGSNPWMSHGLQRARMVINEIARDGNRTLIVVDPRRHETAQKADIYLQIRPGTDLYFLLAMLNVIVKEGLADEAFIAAHAHGWEHAQFIADLVTPGQAAKLCDLREADIVAVACRFATAQSASIKADLGIYQNKHTVENSYLLPLLHIITGNMCTADGAHFPVSMSTGAGVFKDVKTAERPRTRVAGIPVIRGLFPPNAIAEEILDAGPERIRALFVEACNPLRSYADTERMTEAFEDLELLVVIDPAMTEPARLAHYVLPVPVGYEKWEASVFPKGHPAVYMHLRPPILAPPPEAKQECFIFYELAKAMGLNYSAFPPFGALEAAIAAAKEAPVLSLIKGLSLAFAMNNFQALVEAGTISGDGDASEEIFQKLLDHPEGVLLCRVDADQNWNQVRTADKKAVLNAPEILDMFRHLEIPEDTDFRNNPVYPFILQTGERTDHTANTIHRDPAWRKKQHTSYLRMHQAVAAELRISDGETVRLITAQAEVMIPALVTEDIYPGNLSIPHGYGLLWENAETGALEQVGVNVQALVSAQHRDPLSGVPYHKHIPCRVEKLAAN
ncbi:MAG: molybdopterin-dependent oxidoreductase [Candidatus Methylomirabilia bacterium]